jgi:twinkle protein
MLGKVSIWSGPTFSGKTAFLRQLMLHAVLNRHKVLFISLEEKPDEVWREFLCMACLTRNPTEAQRELCLEIWEERLYVFDSTELIEPTLLMGIVRFAVERFGITHIVIDSLMRMKLRNDDYDGQREMGNMLGRLARLANAHIHLVVHPRKTANSREPMDLYDIRGAQDIIAQADLVVTLERKHDKEHDAMLTVWKQRGDINWIGNIPLFYDKPSRQLKFRAFDSATRFMPDAVYT